MKQANTTEQKDLEMLDPDVRFLLANERTLLAWVRTALALLAGGLAFTQFGVATSSTSIVGIVVLAMGAVMTLLGLIRFRAADTAIRKGELPVAGRGPQFQVLAVIALAVVLIMIELSSLV